MKREAGIHSTVTYSVSGHQQLSFPVNKQCLDPLTEETTTIDAIMMPKLPDTHLQYMKIKSDHFSPC